MPEGVKLIAVLLIMRVLLRLTAYLFWQYPILWLPVLFADLLKFWVILAGHWLAHMASFATLHHSAITGAPEMPSGTRMIWFSTAGGIFIWGGNFIGVALYCFALGVLTRMISGFQPEEEVTATERPPLDPDLTTSPIWKNEDAASEGIGKLKFALPNKWIRCSVLALLAFMLALLGSVLLTRYSLQSQFHHRYPELSDRATVFFFIFIGAFLSLAPILSFISANLTPQPRSLENRVSLNRPRLFAYGITAVFCFAYIALWLSLNLVTRRLFQDIPISRMTFLRNITEMIGSLVVAIPFIPAMMALILVMREELQTTTLPQTQ